MEALVRVVQGTAKQDGEEWVVELGLPGGTFRSRNKLEAVTEAVRFLADALSRGADR